MCLGFKGSLFFALKKQEKFSSKVCRQALVPTQSATEPIPWAFIRRFKRDANYSPASSAEVKSERSYSYIPPDAFRKCTVYENK
jgi:hypothetical protein